jgi:hypothetical protein
LKRLPEKTKKARAANKKRFLATALAAILFKVFGFLALGEGCRNRPAP